VERTVPQYQLRRESRLRVLEGHFPPSMIGECRCRQLGLGGLRTLVHSRALVELAPPHQIKEVLDFVVTPK